MRDPILDALLGAPEQTEIPFEALMPRRVKNLLLVTSLYDSYTFIEDGRLSEMLLGEFMELHLQSSPNIRRVSTAREALDLIGREAFDLVISMPRVGDMNVREFGPAVQALAPGLPVILLASSLRELGQLQGVEELKGIQEVFVWLGDVSLFLAMVKCVEDRMNALHDARLAGVKCILVVEDDIAFCSASLPVLYTEVMRQALGPMADGINRSQRVLRRRARPKILLAHHFEAAMATLETHGKDLAALILDAAFPRAGRMDVEAGKAFAAVVAERFPDLPILVQSNGEYLDPRGRGSGHVPGQSLARPGRRPAGLPGGTPGLRGLRLPPSGRLRGDPGRGSPQPRVGCPGRAGRVSRGPRPSRGPQPLGVGPHRVRAGRDPGPHRGLRAHGA